MSNGIESNWGGANRPYTSLRLSSAPHKSEGADGDLQIRQTQLGAKLFGKIGGRWYDNPFSVDGTTKIGTKLSDHLAITREGIEVYENDVKGASFGSTMNVGNWNINSTSIYTGIEDHSGYTANAGDITLYSDGSDSSLHAKEFYINTAGRIFTTNATIGAGSSFAGDSIGVAYTDATDDTAAATAQAAIDAMEAQVVIGAAQIDIKTADQSPDFKLARFGSTINIYDGTVNEVVKVAANSTGVKLYGDNATTYTHVDSNGIRLYDNSVLAATFQAGGAIIGPVADDTSRLILTGGALQFVNRQSTTDTVTAQLTDAGVFSVANINLTGQITITSTGTENVVIGTDNNDAGDKNIVLGVEAGNAITDGSANILLGYKAGTKIQGGDGNVCIGARAGEEAVATASLVAIGTAALSNCTGSNNVAIGSLAGDAITDADNNVLIGEDANKFGNSSDCVSVGYKAGSGVGGTGYAGDGSICIGYQSGVGTNNDANSIVIGSDAIGHGANICVIGNADVTAIHPADDGGVNLGSAAYSYDAVWAADGAFNVSDRRIKEDITSLSLGLEFINKLNPVSYKKKDKEAVYDGDRLTQRAITYKRKHAGLIAQEVKQVMDDMGIDSNDFSGYVDANVNEGVDKLFLRYEEFIAPIVKAVQELSTKLDTMQTEIKNLKAE